MLRIMRRKIFFKKKPPSFSSSGFACSGIFVSYTRSMYVSRGSRWFRWWDTVPILWIMGRKEKKNSFLSKLWDCVSCFRTYFFTLSCLGGGRARGPMRRSQRSASLSSFFISAWHSPGSFYSLTSRFEIPQKKKKSLPVVLVLVIGAGRAFEWNDRWWYTILSFPFSDPLTIAIKHTFSFRPKMGGCRGEGGERLW